MTDNALKPGDRVKVSTEIRVEAEAVVEAVEENGVVIRIDPKTYVPLWEGDLLALHRYYAGLPLENPDDPNLQWVGQAHIDSMEPL